MNQSLKDKVCMCRDCEEGIVGGSCVSKDIGAGRMGYKEQ